MIAFEMNEVIKKRIYYKLKDLTRVDLLMFCKVNNMNEEEAMIYIISEYLREVRKTYPVYLHKNNEKMKYAFKIDNTRYKIKKSSKLKKLW